MASRDFIEEFFIVITNAVVFIGSGKVVMNASKGFYSFGAAVEPFEIKGFS